MKIKIIISFKVTRWLAIWWAQWKSSGHFGWSTWTDHSSYLSLGLFFQILNLCYFLSKSIFIVTNPQTFLIMYLGIIVPLQFGIAISDLDQNTALLIFIRNIFDGFKILQGLIVISFLEMEVSQGFIKLHTSIFQKLNGLLGLSCLFKCPDYIIAHVLTNFLPFV